MTQLQRDIERSIERELREARRKPTHKWPKEWAGCYTAENLNLKPEPILKIKTVSSWC